MSFAWRNFLGVGVTRQGCTSQRPAMLIHPVQFGKYGGGFADEDPQEALGRSPSISHISPRFESAAAW